MKSGDQPSLYFSAYPLKALNQESSVKPSEGQSPYLKAILSGKTRTMSRVRVFPMINPYRLSATIKTKTTEQLPTDIALTEKEWFNNYE